LRWGPGPLQREVTRHDAGAKTVPMATIRLMEPVRLGEYGRVDNPSRISEKVDAHRQSIAMG
jgi:hypothetical protein